MAGRTTVLITGATGNIGRGESALQVADLSVHDEAWAKPFEGFSPQDGEAQQLSLAHRLRNAWAWLRYEALPSLVEALPGRRW